MPVATRTARTAWEGPLASGSGTLTSESGSLDGREVSWPARTEEHGGRTSPEELCAAAHSSCFSMALSLMLGEAGSPPEKLNVGSAVTLDEVDGKPTVVSSAITVEASVPGIGQDAFDQAVEDAAGLCPVSRLFAGAEITVEAKLLDT